MNPRRICEHFNEVQAEIFRLKSGSDSSCQANYINHIETGSATPSLAGLSYICEYLGITMSEFFDFDSCNPTKLNKINEYLKKLDDEQLEIVENLVKNLANK